MPDKIHFSAAMDEAVVFMRSRGVTLDAIAESIGTGRHVVVMAIRRLFPGGDPGRQARQAARNMLPSASVPRDEVGVMRAGDPISWGAITRGTLLEGAPYGER